MTINKVKDSYNPLIKNLKEISYGSFRHLLIYLIYALTEDNNKI
jgi:hypothetical protein